MLPIGSGRPCSDNLSPRHIGSPGASVGAPELVSPCPFHLPEGSRQRQRAHLSAHVCRSPGQCLASYRQVAGGNAPELVRSSGDPIKMDSHAPRSAAARRTARPGQEGRASPGKDPRAHPAGRRPVSVPCAPWCGCSPFPGFPRRVGKSHPSHRQNRSFVRLNVGRVPCPPWLSFEFV